MLLLPIFAACAQAPPSGVTPCPPSPNCVSTASPADDPVHHAEPLVFNGDMSAAIARMRTIIEAMPRTALVEQTSTGLRYTFTSRLWRFVDDVQLTFDPSGRIDYRSASRVGYGDMGANRARMEAIATAWKTP